MHVPPVSSVVVLLARVSELLVAAHAEHDNKKTQRDSSRIAHSYISLSGHNSRLLQRPNFQKLLQTRTAPLCAPVLLYILCSGAALESWAAFEFGRGARLVPWGPVSGGLAQGAGWWRRLTIVGFRLSTLVVPRVPGYTRLHSYTGLYTVVCTT